MSESSASHARSSDNLLAVLKSLEEELVASKKSYEEMCQTFSCTLDFKNSELAELRNQLESAKNALREEKLQDVFSHHPVPAASIACTEDEESRSFQPALIELESQNRLLKQALSLKEEQLIVLETDKRRIAFEIIHQKLKFSEVSVKYEKLLKSLREQEEEYVLLKDRFRCADAIRNSLEYEVLTLKEQRNAAYDEVEAFAEMISESCHVNLCSIDLKRLDPELLDSLSRNAKCETCSAGLRLLLKAGQNTKRVTFATGCDSPIINESRKSCETSDGRSRVGKKFNELSESLMGLRNEIAFLKFSMHRVPI